jgi:CheY-like chemotaxis protein
MGDHRHLHAVVFSVLSPHKRMDKVRSAMLIGDSMSGHGHRIMIVEDDADIREALRDALGDTGRYEVFEAINGAEALAHLHAHPRKPCVILLDVMMPEINGWEFRRAQLADPRLAEIPVVVFTAHANASGAAADLSAAGFLKKPATLSALVAMIDLHCRRD